MSEDTITRAELAAVFREGFPFNPAGSHLAAADQVFAHVARSREPEYEPGAVCQDASGQVWLRCAGRMWLAFGKAGEHSDNFPKRPLRKLVPEGGAEDRLRKHLESIAAHLPAIRHALEFTCGHGEARIDCHKALDALDEVWPF